MSGQLAATAEVVADDVDVDVLAVAETVRPHTTGAAFAVACPIRGERLSTGQAETASRVVRTVTRSVTDGDLARLASAVGQGASDLDLDVLGGVKEGGQLVV